LEDRQQLAKADPGNPERERAVALSYNYVGDALRARGNTKWSSDNNGARADTHEALSDYRNAMSIIGELVKRQPNNSNWQHDRVDCYDRIGSVSTNLGAALDAYKSGLVIMLRLAAANQRNVDWQHQLALEYNNIGGLLAYENNRRDALRNYEQNRRIITKLAESQPGVTEWQKELAVEEFWISKVSDEPAARKAALDSALAIANTLARNHKLPHDLQTLPYEIRDELSKLQSSGK
jgi:tetratricopeptide (TPR) repeat protein